MQLPVSKSYSSFKPVLSIHCLAALYLGARVEQPFECLIVQNRQAVQSMRSSMDWTLEDNMVDGLFFCATLTGCRVSHTQFVQAGVETSDTGTEAVSQTQAVPGRIIPEGWVPVSEVNIQSLVKLFNHFALHWWFPRVAHACCCCQIQSRINNSSKCSNCYGTCAFGGPVAFCNKYYCIKQISFSLGSQYFAKFSASSKRRFSIERSLYPEFIVWFSVHSHVTKDMGLRSAVLPF